MAGYYGYKMSNNAVSAYEDGYKPKSKWTKQAIIDELLENTSLSQDDFKGISAEVLKGTLHYEGWHHTSSKYNETAFYSVNTDLTRDDLEQLREDTKQARKQAKTAPKEEEKPVKVLFSYVEWTGTRKHPKAEDRQAYGVLKNGRIYYLDCGCTHYKLYSGKYVSIDKYFTRAPRGTAKEFNQILKSL